MMRTLCLLAVACFATLIALNPAHGQSLVELITNGDSETGDTSGWEYFPTGGSTFDVVSTPATDVFAGAFSSKIENLTETSNAFIRQTAIGIGVVEPSADVNISFWAKGSGDLGGVQFAEFFSLGENGGVTSSVILNNSTPLFLTDTYEFYEFTTTAASDVSGGVTLQLGATTAANVGSTATFFFDDVSVTTLSDVSLPGDFDADGDVDGDDVDFYIGNIGAAATGELAQLDLDEDGTVTLDDHNTHLTTLVQTSNGVTGALLGDVNLDGSVDVLTDAFALVGNLSQSATSRSQGDLNADGTVNVLGDGFILVGGLGQSNNPGSSVSASAVPEPGSLAMLALAAVGVVSRRQRS